MAVTALVVPDAGAWALWGYDLSALGYETATSPEEATVLIGPARVPGPLVPAVRAAWGTLGASRRHLALADALADGEPLEAVLGSPAGGSAAHGHTDHGDVMAITGEPSADGLVMEDADLELGPLLSPLPGGLVAHVKLDGDVVAGCTVEALLCAPAGSMAPDPLADRAWDAALARARGERSGWGRRLAGVEVERALSHLVWLRGLGEILGWAELVDRTRQAVVAVLSLRRDVDGEAAAAQRAVDRVAGLLEGSRRLRSRTRGVAVVSAQEAADRGLAGPNARASADGGDGDAHARIVLRAAEAAQALRHADRLRAEDAPVPEAIEGPRGPVRVESAAIGRPLGLEAGGVAAALTAAGDHAIGLEWSRALVALHSFDLSPWKVAT